MFFLWILLALAAGLFLLTRLRAKSVTRDPQVVVYDSRSAAGGSAPGTVPKIIWSYWHAGRPPLVVERCIHNWTMHNPGYAINVVSGDALEKFVNLDELPERFARCSPARQSDWLRLYLLRRYGGIWLDASSILTDSLDWMIEAQRSSGSDYVGFFIDRYTVRPECPVIDSWCMAAPAGSPFIRDWFEELGIKAFTIGDQAYLDELASQGIAETVIQKIASPPYMMIHVTGQRVLHRGGAYRLHLIRAEDLAFFYHFSRLKRMRVFASLLLLKRPRVAPRLIKLRGGERRKLEPYLKWRLFTRESIVGRDLFGDEAN